MVSISQERSRLNSVDGAPPMRRRSQWGARKSYTDARTVTEPATRVFIHISVTNPSSYNGNDAHARALESIGISRFPSTGISYNRGIMHNGAIYEFQPVGRRGAHTVNDFRRSSCSTSGCPGRGKAITAPSWNLNYNARAYVICQNVGDSVTDSMVDSIAKQIVADYRAGFITRAAAHNFHGHRCVSSKSCPGNRMWARMDDLHTQVHNYLDNGLDGDDMPSPKDWSSADWAAFEEHFEGAFKRMPFKVPNVRDDSGNEKDSNLYTQLRWHLFRLVYYLNVRQPRIEDKMNALLDSVGGQDADTIKAHIDAVHAEAKADREGVMTKLDDLVSLVESFDASEMTAEEVAEALKALMHDMTTPDAEGN